MRNGTLLFFLLLASVLRSQAFWTENFNATSCLVGCPAPGYSSSNGSWTQSILATEGASPNRWFISCKENNNGAGNCSNACTVSGNQTLHVSSDPSLLTCPNDCGAQYGLGASAITDRRIESPTINCSGYVNVYVSFLYFCQGNLPNDIGVFWYYDGSSWTAISAMGQTSNSTCGFGHGQWTTQSFALPSSAYNNPNVKIGFEWKNSSTGTGLATSMAIDDVTINGSLPTVYPSFNLTAPACSGLPLTGTYTGTTTATGYTWTASPSGNVLIGAPNSASTSFTFAAPGTYSVSLTASATGSLTGAVTNTILVNAQPTLLTSQSSPTVCTGNTATLTAMGTSAYAWVASQGANPPPTNSVVVSPTVTTTYTVTGTTAAGCSDTAVFTVSVTPVSTFVSPVTSTICPSGSGVVLSASGTTTYSWAPGAGLSATTGATVMATPVATTIYTVTGTTGLCSATATTTVNVYVPAPNGLSASANPICQGGAGTPLTASGATTYTWTPATGLSATNGAIVTANPTVTTTYTVAGQTASGCLTLPSVITISVTPPFTAAITTPTTVLCNGSTVGMTVTPNGSGYSYTWSPVGAIQGPATGATVAAHPTVNTTYSVTLSMGGCQAQATQTITVVNCILPVANYTVLTNDSICVGGCITFSSTSTGSPDSLHWYFPGATPPYMSTQSTTVQACYVLQGTYPVSLIAFNVFGSDTLLVPQAVWVADTVHAVALQDTTIRIGQSAPLSASGGSFYFWSPGNGLACPTCSMTTASPTVTTTYTVQVSNSPYCYSQDTVRVNVNFICGDIFVPNAFSPNGDGLNDTLHVRGVCLSTFIFRVFNRWGQKVFESQSRSEGWDGTFEGQPLEPGVFIYNLEGTTLDNKPVSKKGNITILR